MNPACRVSWFNVTVSMFVVLCVAGAAFGQLNEPMEGTWVANGPVFAMESNADALYLGGNFTYVGPSTGCAVRLQDDGTLAAAPAFPKVNGAVHAAVSDGAGGWYIGGDFTRVGAELRNRIAHVLVDGSVDAAWNPNINNTVYALALSSDGLTVYAGGAFTRIGTETCRYLGAIDADIASPDYGKVLSAWDPGLDDFVRAMVISSDGLTLFTGGNFGSYAKAYDLSVFPPTVAFTPVVDGMVRTMALTPDGTKLFMGGWFTDHLIAVDPASGGLIAGFNPVVNNPVMSLAATNTEVYAGGSFNEVNYETRNGIVALDVVTGDNITAWAPEANGWVTALAVSPDGVTVYAGGEFTDIGGAARQHIARLDAVGQGDDTGRAIALWDAGAGDAVYVLNAVLEGPDEYLYAGGAFTTVNGVVRNNLAALDANSLSLTYGEALAWDPGADGAVYAMAMDAPGTTVFVGGMFSEVSATPASHIAALNAVDHTIVVWAAPDVDDTVRTLELPPSGAILYAGGDFTVVEGSARTYIAALDAGTGGLINAWNPAPNAPVNAIAATNVEVYVGGEFTTIGGQTRNYLAGLDVIAGNATSFVVNANYPVHSLALTAAFDRLYVGGEFTTIGGQPRNRLAAVDTLLPGTVLPWTNPGFNGTVECMLLDEGKETLWVGGNFVSPLLRLAAVDLDPLLFGNLTPWDPRADNPVYGLDQSASGTSIYAGGAFATVGGNAFSGSGGYSRSYLGHFVLRPVITLNGSNPVTLECRTVIYVEAGATAVDAAGNDLTPLIVIGGDVVDADVVGTYIITYDVTDSGGNPAIQVTRTVNVVDTLSPAISLLGPNPVSLECGDAYMESGTFTLDTCDGDISASVVIDSSGLNVNAVGVYQVLYNVTDGSGNPALQVSRSVSVIDITIPVITLQGLDPVTSELNMPYVDAGATAADVCDGDITGSIVTVNPVDITTVGTYTVTYTVSDGAGNAALPVTRKVNIVDTANPFVVSITVESDREIRITYNKNMGVGVDVPANYVLSGPGMGTLAPNPDSVAAIDGANYRLTWSCPSIMFGGQNVTVTVDVNVVDIYGNLMNPLVNFGTDVALATLPVITLNGGDETVECAGVYADAGATATDACGTDRTASIVTVNPVNTAVPGAYTVTYNVTDAAGNAAVQVTRTVNVTDATVPVITLLGNATETVECGDAYADAGAMAADLCDGDLTAVIVTTNPVNTGIPGSYTVRYNVSDAAANAAVEVTRTVTVADTTIPVITLNGNNPETVECGSAYTDAGATAADVCGGNLTASIITVNSVNAVLVGSYTVTYDVSDASANAAVQVTRTVNVVDTTAPVIIRLGNDPETADCGLPYVDAGVTSLDGCDGDITAAVVTVNGVNTAVPGSYTVTYDVSDAALNAAVQVTRTVNVVDVTGPVITLNGANPMTVECNAGYAEPGATALDDCEGDLTASIVVDFSAVDTSVLGSYVVTYNVLDGAGNAAAEVIRAVDVVDTAAPVITLLGANPVTIECGAPYTEDGATALDACEGDLSASIVIDASGVATGAAGSYVVRYNVSDTAANATVEVQRTVNVVDTAPPVIALAGLPVETVECGTAYVDAGAAALDVCNGDLTAFLVINNPVNTSAVGVYTITYNVSDGAANAALAVTRVVNVVDLMPPVITLLGAPVATVVCGAVYADAGVTALDACEGDISGFVTAVSTVNTGVVGSYTVTYDVTDGAGNAAAQVVRTVNVVDMLPPLITLNGISPVTVECGMVYADAGATALDLCDGDLTGAILAVNPVNTNLPGIYMVTYNVMDAAGNMAVQTERTVNVVDTTAPVITLIGDPVVTKDFGLPYVDPGATAADICFGDLTPAIVVLSPVAVVSPVGVYTITYNVVDGVGNAAVQAERTVYVVDPAFPYVDQVQVIDPTRVRVRFNRDMGSNDLNPLDYTVSGTGQGLLPPNPIGVIPVDPFTYDLIWGCPFLMRNGGDITITVAGTITDGLGISMEAPFARTHFGGAIAAVPVIALVGAPVETIECAAVYVDAGATALDACGMDISGAVVALNPVNTGVVGSYTVTYNVNDAGGNSAVEVSRIVNVVDTAPPAIALLGLPIETAECGAVYVDAGAMALDACEGDISASLVVDNQVNIAIPGVYVVNFDVADSAGNAAVRVTRTVNVVDTMPPMITLLGTNPITVECGSGYTDSGATAADACEGDLTAAITVVNPVNTGISGVYTVTYDVSDTAANAAVQATRTVTVSDTTPPVITLNGNATETVECGSAYVDAGATAADVCDGDLTAAITAVNLVNTAVAGAYTVTYDVSDTGGNAALQAVRTVDVVDTTAPVITLLGNSEVSVDQFTVYSDAGVTAIDVCEGDLTGSVVEVNPVDTSVIGTYIITWNITDASGNTAAEVSRTVFVVDPARPFVSSVTVTGPRTVAVVFSKNMGAMALDALNYTLSGSGTGSLQATPNLVTGALDTYTLEWLCPDIMLDGGDITITVNAAVEDDASNAMSPPLARTDFGGAVATAPVITLVGLTPVAVECGGTYTDDGATAVDECGADITASIVTLNPVDEAIVGSYTVTYNVTDTAGNIAAEVVRIVDVQDTTAPIIALTGTSPVNVECGGTYTDDGATALDDCDGDLTAAIVTLNPVDPAVTGSYTVSYNVSDAEGNAAAQVTRTVTVDDTDIPVITLTGAAALTIECGAVYADAGATAVDVCDGVLTGSITVVNPVNTAVVGGYTVTYDVSDNALNVAVQVTRTVTVQDTTVPVITLLGNAIETVECGAVYADAGATAADVCEGNLTASITVVNPVNTAAVGAYTVTYDVSDTALNAAAQIMRTVNVVDTTGPVITINGPAVYPVTLGGVYTEPGATALDACEGATAVVIGGAVVDTGVLGAYLVDYDSQDSLANVAATVTRTVNVVDTPFVTDVTVESSHTVLVTFSEPMGIGADVAANYTISGAGAGTLNLNPDTALLDAGNTYRLTWSCPGMMIDGDDVTITVDALVEDLSGSVMGAPLSGTDVGGGIGAPVITLLGGNPETVQCGAVYADAGATAADVCATDITASLVIDDSAVNMAVPGSYNVIVTATDGLGNIGQEIRVVDVQDTTAPVITLNGAAALTLQCGVGTYTELGATALDVCDGPVAVVIGGPVVDTAVPGIYVVTYDASDGAGNAAAQVIRTVTVLDVTGPVITLNGAAMLSLECGVDTYTELGATALDACDGPAAVLIGGAVVNPSVAGIYVVTYDAADGGGNAAIQVIRTVNVLDNAAPVITLVGADPLTLECNGLIADPGATALDVCDGDLTGSIIATNDIVIGTPGAYEMRYNVTDGAGLSAVQVTRTVNVVDTQPPLLTLGVNWPFVTNVVSGFIEVPCGFALATNHPLDFLVVDACTGPILPPIRSDKLPGLPGVFGLPGQPGIYVYAWELGPGKIPLWTGIPGFSQPVVRRFDEIQLPPTGEYLLIYVVQDQTGNTYPPLDINGIPPIFDGAWNPIFQVADVLLPAIDFARLIRVNCGKSNPSAFNIATELDERFEVYDINDDGTLDESEIAAAYYVLQQIYPDLDQVTYNEIIDQLSSGTGMLNEVQVRAFVDAHDAPCDPDETPPSVLFKNITLELDEAGQASLFTSAALYGTAAITYLYDNCLGDGAENLSAFTITATQDAFTCDNVGDVEVTITVSDGIKTASGTVTVTVTEGAATCAGRCGCTGGCNKNLGVGDYRKMLADWLLIGVTLSCMFAYGAIRRH